MNNSGIIVLKAKLEAIARKYIIFSYMVLYSNGFKWK